MTHEMFGYDFMVDESYNVWFIEINSSPSMDYSTVKKKKIFYLREKINLFLLNLIILYKPVTTRLVK
jgi:hypothetical protein